MEDADHWWESHSKTTTQDQQVNLTWDEFQQTIIQKYIPSSYRDQKEAEFLCLRQGSMTVIEYDRKFSQLSRYASHLVDTDAKKTQRFEKRLRSEISCSILAGLGSLTYAEVLDRAQKIEYRAQSIYGNKKSSDRAGIDKRKLGDGVPNDDVNIKQLKIGEGSHQVQRNSSGYVKTVEKII